MSREQLSPEIVDVLGLPVSYANLQIPEDLDAAKNLGYATIVTFVNPHACFVSSKNEDYLRNLQDFDWVLCDGIGMVIAARRILGSNYERAAFDLTSVAGPACSWLSQNKIPVVLVGGKPGISESAAELLTGLFPGLHVYETFSGYDDDPSRAIELLSQNAHHAVICGMGAPRQEQFLIDLKNTGWSGIGFTCGGFFDQLVDRVDYYPAWVDNLNLRFLYRLLKEPGRLWKRYLVEYQVFTGRYLKSLFQK